MLAVLYLLDAMVNSQLPDLDRWMTVKLLKCHASKPTQKLIANSFMNNSII